MVELSLQSWVNNPSGRQRHSSDCDFSYYHNDYCSEYESYDVLPTETTIKPIITTSTRTTTIKTAAATKTTTETSKLPLPYGTTVPQKPKSTTGGPESAQNADIDVSGFDIDLLITGVVSCFGTLGLGLSVRAVVRWRQGKLQICCTARAQPVDPESSRAPINSTYDLMNESETFVSFDTTGRSVKNPYHSSNFSTSTPKRFSEPHPRIQEVDPAKLPKLKTLREILGRKKETKSPRTNRTGSIVIPQTFVHINQPTPPPKEETEDKTNTEEELPPIPEASDEDKPEEPEDELSLTQFFEQLQLPPQGPESKNIFQILFT